MRRLSVCLALLATLGGTCFATEASADVFGPISLASAGLPVGGANAEQANRASDSTISGNGRYVAFDGLFGGRPGVFRRDLETGEVAMVAEGDAVDPSISADGRYVSFSTTVRLDEANDLNLAPDVYVRDMSKPDSEACPSNWQESSSLQEACAFSLVSAIDGGSQGLVYAYSGANLPIEQTHFGAVASGRSALSGDGHLVAFVTTARSNLANPGRAAPAGLPEAAETPPLEVAVRNLETKTTELVSVVRDPSTGGAQLDASGQPEPVPSLSEGGSITYGAAYSGGSLEDDRFPEGGAGASISGDGSTVAWMGQDVGQQAPTLAGSDYAEKPQYTEALWRRIGEGQGAATRRVTGGSDPSSPFCASSGELQLSVPPTLSDPCQGPFDTTNDGGSSTFGLWNLGSQGDYVPQLSEDGVTVAFLATAREIASGEELKVGEASDDLYVVNMQDGLTRVEAARRLTELAGGSTSDPARTAPIVDLAVSPDGSQVAFTTRRTVFPFGSPAYVSTPAASVGIVELYDVDFANDTLTRVTEGFNGEPSEAPTGEAGRTGSPSFSADGNRLAFSSEADNLVYGDGNASGDAFVIPRERFAALPTPQLISPISTRPSLSPSWSLGVSAFSRPNGSVVLDVQVPGAGALRAAAQAPVRVRLRGPIKRAKHHGGARRAKTHTVVRTRTLATRSAGPRGEGVSVLTLTLARPYATLARAHGGLSANVSLTFGAPGHKTLRQTIAVTFLQTAVRKRAERSSKSSAVVDRRGGR